MTGPKSKRVCMIAFTHYPFDGRVRLEAESLVEWGYEVCFLVPKERATATTYMLAGVIVKELKSRFAAIITNGQGEMKGQIFRIAHIGFFDYMDTIAIIGALEQVAASSLKLPGFEFGKAVAAAQKVYAERTAKAAEALEAVGAR